MTPLTRRALLATIPGLAALAVGLIAQAADADEDGERGESDHDEAYRAREGGDILPLPDLLARVGPRIDGEIIEIEFEYENGRPVYEFKYVDSSGRVRKVYADAHTGAVFKDRPD